MLILLQSWSQSDAVPEGWQPADPPGAVRKQWVKDSVVRRILKTMLPGEWRKVHHLGKDGSELHYFQHQSGAVAGVKHKLKRR